MRKRWLVDESSVEIDIVNRLKNELNCPKFIAEFLVKKNIVSRDKANKFFYPKFMHLNDPFLFKDVKKAINRIWQAIENDEKILVYGDYDVDGTTATSILLLGLQELDANIEFYIPNRMIEGYGLSAEGNTTIIEREIDLVITVDCGINAVEEVEELNKMGIDVIITDHHTPQKILPKAYAVLDPKLKGSTYPYSELSGSGIAFKLLHALFLQRDKTGIEKYTDLAGFGTIADIVPLNGENRTLATLGIEQMESRQNLGLKHLMKFCGLKTKSIKSSDVVFRLAPRINAAGRLSSADKAVKLMTSKYPEPAEFLARSIHMENQKRQQIDQTTFHRACDLIDAKYDNLDDVYFIVLASEDWHPGVVGIVASKIVEKYNRPTILITIDNGEGCGSGRSIRNFNIFKCLQHFKDDLISFGGHKYAAGLSILPEYIPKFEKEINEYAKAAISAEDIKPQIRISSELKLKTIDFEFIKWLKLLAPFGPSNMNPVFMSKNVKVIGYPYTVGTNHLKMKVGKANHILNLIGFNMGELAPSLKKGSAVDIAYSLEENVWKDKRRIQGKLKDIRPHNGY
ncbi:MAG: single-stranded-DNA-specific exonuclease RecJ [Candidatus Cloacimonetes bacterium]|nr:single-stranded-DNA-specific exonuclease RecJ [Candidatus Cloacimonadota bacterium]MBS3767082.1 single-stranded-DNA-specific exonuclease RecJ [Candidatus Cloacimonadota bacterium]